MDANSRERFVIAQHYAEGAMQYCLILEKCMNVKNPRCMQSYEIIMFAISSSLIMEYYKLFDANFSYYSIKKPFYKEIYEKVSEMHQSKGKFEEVNRVRSNIASIRGSFIAHAGEMGKNRELIERLSKQVALPVIIADCAAIYDKINEKVNNLSLSKKLLQLDELADKFHASIVDQ